MRADLVCNGPLVRGRFPIPLDFNIVVAREKKRNLSYDLCDARIIELLGLKEWLKNALVSR